MGVNVTEVEVGDLVLMRGHPKPWKVLAVDGEYLRIALDGRVELETISCSLTFPSPPFEVEFDQEVFAAVPAARSAGTDASPSFPSPDSHERPYSSKPGAPGDRSPSPSRNDPRG